MNPGVSLRVEPFTIAIAEDALADLRARLAGTRWPEPAPGAPWEQGVDRTYLAELVDYWRDGFDWRTQERELNR